jgi:MFS family permease
LAGVVVQSQWYSVLVSSYRTVSGCLSGVSPDRVNEPLRGERSEKPIFHRTCTAAHRALSSSIKAALAPYWRRLMSESVRLSHSRWLVLARVAVIGFVIEGSGAGVIGLAFSPLMTELGWSNSQTSTLGAAFIVGGLLTIAAVGVALDKYGAPTIMAFGTLVASIGLVWAGHCHSWSAMMGAFALAGMGFSASFYLPSAVVVTNWMTTQRSLGMGIVMGAVSAGAALFSPLIGWWTELYGWRLTVDGIAALLALMLPLILLTVRTKPPGGQLPRNFAVDSTDTHKARRDLLSATFILMVASAALVAIGMFGIYFHVVPLLVNAGYSAPLAGLAFGGTWLLSGLGSLVLGIVADRLGAKPILAGALLCCVLGTLFLHGAAERGVGVPCVVAFVLLWGASANSFCQLVPVILAERFGSQSLGTLIGVQAAIAGIAGATAPVITGLLYDKFGGYRLAIDFSASATFIGFVFLLLVNTAKRVDCEFTTQNLEVAT